MPANSGQIPKRNRLKKGSAPAAEVFKSSAKDTPAEFLDIASNIFNWCLSGKEIDKTPDSATTKEWK